MFPPVSNVDCGRARDLGKARPCPPCSGCPQGSYSESVVRSQLSPACCLRPAIPLKPDFCIWVALANSAAISEMINLLFNLISCHHTTVLVLISSTLLQKKFLGHACPTPDLRVPQKYLLYSKQPGGWVWANSYQATHVIHV